MCPGLDPADPEEDEVPGGELMDKGQSPGVPDGWYLALAQAEEGRLVLTRLVRWTRGDKELRKFIRVLLKKPCTEQ